MSKHDHTQTHGATINKDMSPFSLKTANYQNLKRYHEIILIIKVIIRQLQHWENGKEYTLKKIKIQNQSPFPSKMVLYIISEGPHWAVGQFLDQPCLICPFGAYFIDGRLDDAYISTYRIIVITSIPVIIESCAIIKYKTTLAHSSSSCLLQCGSEILETTLKHNTITYLVAGLSSHKLIFICVE